MSAQDQFPQGRDQQLRQSQSALPPQNSFPLQVQSSDTAHDQHPTSYWLYPSPSPVDSSVSGFNAPQNSPFQGQNPPFPLQIHFQPTDESTGHPANLNYPPLRETHAESHISPTNGPSLQLLQWNRHHHLFQPRPGSYLPSDLDSRPSPNDRPSSRQSQGSFSSNTIANPSLSPRPTFTPGPAGFGSTSNSSLYQYTGPTSTENESNATDNDEPGSPEPGPQSEEDSGLLATVSDRARDAPIGTNIHAGNAQQNNMTNTAGAIYSWAFPEEVVEVKVKNQTHATAYNAQSLYPQHAGDQQQTHGGTVENTGGLAVVPGSQGGLQDKVGGIWGGKGDDGAANSRPESKPQGQAGRAQVQGPSYGQGGQDQGNYEHMYPVQQQYNQQVYPRYQQQQNQQFPSYIPQQYGVQQYAQQQQQQQHRQPHNQVYNQQYTQPKQYNLHSQQQQQQQQEYRQFQNPVYNQQHAQPKQYNPHPHQQQQQQQQIEVLGDSNNMSSYNHNIKAAMEENRKGNGVAATGGRSLGEEETYPYGDHKKHLQQQQLHKLQRDTGSPGAESDTGSEEPDVGSDGRPKPTPAPPSAGQRQRQQQQQQQQQVQPQRPQKPQHQPLQPQHPQQPQHQTLQYQPYQEYGGGHYLAVQFGDLPAGGRYPQHMQGTAGQGHGHGQGYHHVQGQGHTSSSGLGSCLNYWNAYPSQGHHVRRQHEGYTASSGSGSGSSDWNTYHGQDGAESGGQRF